MRKSLAHRLGFVLLAVAAGCGIHSLAPSLRVPPMKVESVDFPLPSGLRVVFEEDRNRPVVSIATVIGTGSAEDPSGKEGLAHLLEHLAFRAHHFSTEPVATRLDELGADNNAFTAMDDTTYIVNAPRDSLRELLRLEAARLTDPLEGVDESTFRHERDVVFAESHERWFSEAAWPLVLEHLYPEGNRYHHAPESPASLERISLDDVRAFAARWYVPSNTTIVVAGDFDRANAGNLLSAAFPRPLVAAARDAGSRELQLATPTPRVSPKSPPPPDPADTSIERISGPVTTPMVVLAWSLPGGFRADAALTSATVDSLHAVIGRNIGLQYGGKGTSWRRGWYRARYLDSACDLDSQRDSSVAYCVIVVAEGQDGTEIAKDALRGLYEFASTGDPRAGYVSSMFADSSLRRRTRTGARYLHYTARADRSARSFEDLGTVSEDLVQKFAKTWITRRRAVALVIEPQPTKDPAGAVSEAGGSTAPNGDGATQLDVPPSPEWFTSLSPSRIEEVARSGQIHEVREETLANGLRVIIARNPAAPLVHASLYVRGGVANATPPGLPTLLSPAWEADDPASFAATWSDENFDDAHVIGIEAPSSYLVEALAALNARARTTHEEWDKLAYNITLDAIETSMAKVKESPDEKASLALRSRLFPNNPLGAGDLNVPDLRKLGHKDFTRWIDATLSPRNSTLVVAGDFQLDAAEDLIVSGWSTWRAKDPGTPVAALAGGSEPIPRTFLAAAAPRPLVSVEIGCRLLPPTSRDLASREVLERLLDGELDQTLRQQTGATYGVHTSTSEWEGGSALLLVRSQVLDDKAATAVQTILARIKALAHGGASPASLVRAKWSIARDGALANETGAATVTLLLGQVHEGMPIDDLQLRPRWSAQTSAKDIAAQVAPCENHEVIATVGSLDAARAASAALSVPLTILN